MEEHTQDPATETPATEAAPVEQPITEPAADVAVDPTATDAGSAMDIVNSVNTTTEGTLSHAAATDLFVELGQSSIYMMGISFVLGSLFTILVLILLDFMRRNSEKK